MLLEQCNYIGVESGQGITENGMQGIAHHEKLRKIRGLRGWKQQYVANALGISEREYGRVENADVELKVARIEAFCQLCNISVVDFFSFEERVFFHQCEQAHAFGTNDT